MAGDKGRGVFAARNIQQGELLILEKPLAQAENNPIMDGNKPKDHKELYDIGN